MTADLPRRTATLLVFLVGCSGDETFIEPEPPEPGVSPDAAALVERLDLDRFKANIEALGNLCTSLVGLAQGAREDQTRNDDES